MTFGGEVRFEPSRTVAVAARPRVRPIQIAAAAARVCVLHSLELEVLFPVRPLFGERRRTEADLDPSNAAICILASGGHVAQVLVAGNRSAAERLASDRIGQRRGFVGFDSRRDQVAHLSSRFYSRSSLLFKPDELSRSLRGTCLADRSRN